MSLFSRKPRAESGHEPDPGRESEVPREAETACASEPDAGLPPAEYYSSDTDLYHLEQLARGRALLEDCRTGALIDVPVSFLRSLRRVRPQSPDPAYRALV